MKKVGFGIAALLLVLLVGLVWSTRSTTSDLAAGSTSPVDVWPSKSPAARPSAASAPSTSEPGATQLPPLPVTSDPDDYAAAVAGVVFGQDTRNTGPEDYRALLMAQADPMMSPRGRADLERMVAERIPAPELWARMRANAQWSQWTTEDVWQPGAWDEVITSGEAEPGWAVRNVLGQQTTHFLDGETSRSTSRERTITVGMRCPAPGAKVDRCMLTMVGIGVVS